MITSFSYFYSGTIVSDDDTLNKSLDILNNKIFTEHFAFESDNVFQSVQIDD